MATSSSSFAVLSSTLFGSWSRYKLDTCRDRFGATCYVVTDAETRDEFGLPAVVRIAGTEEEARKGLEAEEAWEE